MFARKVKNRSGSVSVQVISKEQGRYRVECTVGTSSDPEEIERLWMEAKRRAKEENPKQGRLFSLQSRDDLSAKSFIESFSNADVHVAGPELIFGKLFDRIGLNQIPDAWFRHMVIARLAFPSSKLKTVDYLYRYEGKVVTVDALYKSLDRLHKRHKAQIEKIVYEHTRKRGKGVSVVFYDVTTLYFEAEDEDDLRKIGFSKDGKFQHPQVMLGLLVATGGLPIGYNLYEGNTFEGHTLMTSLKGIEKKYGFKPPVVIADAAMLSKKNLKELEEAGHEYIVGARIKNESDQIKREILKHSVSMKDGDHLFIERDNGSRLLVTYSSTRAHKDSSNRDKGLRRLRKKLKSGRLTKQSINQRGYNKFLTLKGEVMITIDDEKIRRDGKWDGLKGYQTNTKFPAKTIIENYSQLWQIEKAFRISKTDLRIRPIYHYRRRRIESHLCVAFAAYAVYKELESLLKKNRVQMSAQKASELTRTMYELEYTLPDSRTRQRQLLNMDDEQSLLYRVVNEK